MPTSNDDLSRKIDDLIRSQDGLTRSQNDLIRSQKEGIESLRNELCALQERMDDIESRDRTWDRIASAQESVDRRSQGWAPSTRRFHQRPADWLPRSHLDQD
jgi:predicted  nucleic acid-binding Zn-ribbon protein